MVSGSNRESAARHVALPLRVLQALEGQLEVQAERVIALGEQSEGVDRQFLDAVPALTRAAEKLGDLKALCGDADGEAPEDELAELNAFFEATDKRIDELAHERAATLVADDDTVATCPACGAQMRTSGPQGGADPAP
jgi:predicted  nucleic acid-binding Zn-ribbon protein